MESNEKTNVKIKFELCHYGDREYIQYTITDGDEVHQFHNAGYVAFDVTSENFRKLTDRAGGFFANMTTRKINEIKTRTDADVSTIMLCCIPQPTNKFLFQFIYLDKDSNVLDKIFDYNYFDYKFFRHRLADAISEEGFVYDLENRESLNCNTDILTDNICPHPSLDFGIEVDGRQIRANDVFYCYDLSIFKDNIRPNLEKLGAVYATMRFTCDFMNFIHAEGTITDKNGNLILGYQAHSGIQNIEEYIEKMRAEYGTNDYGEGNVDSDPFCFRMNMATLATLADKLTLKNNSPKGKKNNRPKRKNAD